MKLRLLFVTSLLLLSIICFASGSSRAKRTMHRDTEAFPQSGQLGGDSFVYADFEKLENDRPVSSRGGFVQIYTGQETTPARFRGMAKVSPGAPELVKLKADDPNHLASFDFDLTSPNQWANVTLEVQGLPAKDGKQVADDVSAYKHLSIQMYATSVPYLRIEFISHGQGIKLNAGFPQVSVKISPGLNTYKIPFKLLSQPSWVQDKVDTKEVLKKLTAVSISAYCNQCMLQHGTVIIDNMIFEK